MKLKISLIIVTLIALIFIKAKSTNSTFSDTETASTQITTVVDIPIATPIQ